MSEHQSAEVAPSDVDALANLIRTIDGNHDLGAGALAERILASDWLADLLAERERRFTVDEVIEIANETSDSWGNLYRLDFIDRIRHEGDAEYRIPPGQDERS